MPTDFSSYVSDLAPYFEATGYFTLKDDVKTAAGWDAALKTTCTFEQYKKLRDAIDALTYPDSYIVPETGYYRLKNNNYNSYMGLKAVSVYGNYTADADVNGAPTILKLTKNEDSEYSIAIQGKYLGALQQSQYVPTSPDGVAFFKPGILTPGNVSFSVSGEGFTYMHCAEEGPVVGWVLNADASLWTLEDATSINVAVSDAGYATLNVPFAVTIPEGVTAYTGKVNGSYLTMNEISSTIPANTAVVLKADEGSYTFNVS